MGTVTYTAKRSVIPGHTAGLSYTLEIDMASLPPFRARRASTHKALDGNTIETVLQNITKGWSVVTDQITLDPNEDLPAEWEEFIDSVSGGEQFELDVLGSIAIPRNVQDVKLREGAPGQFSRVGARSDRMTLSFNVQVVN
jgi:hypothetical protein